MTDEQKQECERYSKLLARKNEYFIKEHCKRGHSNTVANALMLQKSILHSALGRNTFDASVYMLEVDRILMENEIEGHWFWREN